MGLHLTRMLFRAVIKFVPQTRKIKQTDWGKSIKINHSTELSVKFPVLQIAEINVPLLEHSSCIWHALVMPSFLVNHWTIPDFLMNTNHSMYMYTFHRLFYFFLVVHSVLARNVHPNYFVYKKYRNCVFLVTHQQRLVYIIYVCIAGTHVIVAAHMCT